MRVSLSWLKQLVQVDESVEELEHRLSMAGFEVEEIDDLSANAQGVVVGHVIEREPHPNADNLSVCKVDVETASRCRSCVEQPTSALAFTSRSPPSERCFQRWG